MPSLRAAVLILSLSLVAGALPARLPSSDASPLQQRAAPESNVVADSVLAAIAAEISVAATMAPVAKLQASASVKSTNLGPYSSLVAFGASYTDNAHPRDAKYAGSLRNYYPYSSYGGRYSNGPVAVEQMTGKFGGKLFDYAYGGSVIQNGLYGTGSSWPSATDGMKTYLGDVKSGKVSIGSHVMHLVNTGINAQFSLWNAALASSMSSAAVSKAKQGTSAQVAALAAGLRSIAQSSVVASKARAADFIIVGIPPLEIVPTSAYQVPSKFSSAKKALALNLLKSLVAQYNSELAAFASQLNSEISSKGGKAFFFDLSGLFYDMHANPRNYGISSPTATCYNSSTGKVCGNPSAYIYFDSLHPTTSAHGIIASRISKMVLG